ncbi:hypothetical protein [Nonomuraea sp. B19D2]|uniref:hypothetical protein n=1 Tax=Nonomuraea sp. B19D2 TaxID=3159561 RepID=UPI0032DBC843
MSQAWRRLAQKTSAVGLVSTLVLFVGSVLALSSPAQAAADKTMEVTYTCAAGGAFAATDVKVTITAPDTVAPSQTADIKWTLPPFSATSSLVANTQVAIQGDLTVGGGGTPTALQKVHTGTVAAAGQTYTPSPATMSATVTAPSTGGPITISPGTVSTTKGLKLTATPPGGQASVTECTYKSATPTSLSIAVQTGGGGGNGTDIVAYKCTLASNGGDADYPADVDIKVAMTTPTSASANADASITWTGTIQDTRDPLKAPTGFPTNSPKIFVTIKASGAGVPSSPSPTGEGTLNNVTIGQDITQLPSVTIKVKPTTTGTVTLTPGDLAFGASSTSPFIKCAAPTSGLKTFTFQVGSSTSPSPSPTPTTTSPKPTKTSTHTVTVTPSSKKTTRSKTPKAGADTGGGGEIGPDGRLFILTGTALIGAAAVGGLIMRRRSIRG